jgi:hypothetical protein
MRGPEIVLTFLVGGAAAVFIFALYIRYRRRELQHKERLAAIEKGVALPELTDVEIGPRIYLLRGMIWVFSGIALSVFLFGISVATHRPKSIEDRLREAKVIEQLGGDENQIRQARTDTTPQESVPAAVSLVGLIPFGVGLAYVLFYRIETRRRQ